MNSSFSNSSWSSVRKNEGIDLSFTVPPREFPACHDVGLGKTVEAGLVAARELLLQRRIDFIVITTPPAMTTQRKDELEGVGESA